VGKEADKSMFLSHGSAANAIGSSAQGVKYFSLLEIVRLSGAKYFSLPWWPLAARL